MTRTRIDNQVTDYIEHLRIALLPIDSERRNQILSEISDHIEDALAQISHPSREDIDRILSRMGDPLDIAREAMGGPFSVLDCPERESGLHEKIALGLLLLGGILFIVGWCVGVILLWTSDVWRLRHKVAGTLLLPGGLLPALLIYVARNGSNSETCNNVPIVGSSNFHVICSSTHSGLTGSVPETLGIVIAAATPIVTTLWLYTYLRKHDSLVIARFQYSRDSRDSRDSRASRRIFALVVVTLVVVALALLLVSVLPANSGNTRSSGHVSATQSGINIVCVDAAKLAVSPTSTSILNTLESDAEHVRTSVIAVDVDSIRKAASDRNTDALSLDVQSLLNLCASARPNGAVSESVG